MRIHAIVQVVIAIMFLMVIVSGCINSNSTNQQVITPAPSAAAVEFQKAGFNAYINGKNELALDYYNKSIAADPKYTRAWIDKGNILILLNRTDEAISAFDSALALESNLASVWNSRGEALMTLKRYAEARDSFDKALQISPEYSEAKENRELALTKLN
jgi:tetratricopeptide (TPR) repeat protein